MSDVRRSRWARFTDGLTRIRLAISNLLFFGVLAFVLLSIAVGGPTTAVPDGGALIFEPVGRIVEQQSVADPIERLLDGGEGGAELELQTVIDGFERAASDDRIRMAYVRLDGLQVVGMAHAEAIASAIRRFREAGKQVIAYGSFWDQQAYLIASAADQVYLHPFGQLLLDGFRVENLYFQGLLERLRVNIHVFRAGRYKEFVEPYTRSDMSPEAREVNGALVNALWDRLAASLIEQRALPADRFERFALFPDEALQDTDGDLARLAMEYRFVDELLTPDQMRSRIVEIVGSDDDGEPRGVHLEDYVAATDDASEQAVDESMVAVLTAEGPIAETGSLQGMVAADALIELIRQARDDESVQAVVLRVNSPGGSAFASELIRQELELLQIGGKPLVVSMGPVAASGGYWIAATADEIIAEPMTITGSIGVFGLFPSFERSLGEIGVRSDGVSSSSIGAISPFSGLSDAAGRVLQASTTDVYNRFLNLVARGREMTTDQVDDLAQGRVWLGVDALDRGLVDALGDRQFAIERAAAVANLTSYRVEDLRPALSPGQQILSELAENVWVQDLVGARLNGRSLLDQHVLLREAERALLPLFMAQTEAGLGERRGVYALCDTCLGVGAGRSRFSGL
jgi:protease-4